MTFRTLVALALGCLLLIIHPGAIRDLSAQQAFSPSPDIIERYRAALAADPDNLTLHYLLGIALLQNQRNTEALTELQTAYPAYQDSIEAHFNLAIAALRLNDLDSAEIYLDQALALGADQMQDVFPVADLYFNMALKSRSQNDSNEAIRYFYKVLDLAPQRYEVYRQLGDLYAHLEETDLAIKSFRRYLEQFPDDRVSREYLFALEFNRGQDFLANEEFVQALSHFRAALNVQPDSPTARYYLGYIAYTTGDSQEAAWQLQQAYKSADQDLRQNLRPLLYNTALSLKQAGEESTALKLATQLADSPHAQFNELFLAGNLQLEYGSHRAATDYLQRAVALDAGHQGAQQNLIAAELGAFREWLTIAEASLNRKEFDKAQSALREAEALQPQDSRIATTKRELRLAREEAASAHFSDARAALDEGQLSKALTALEQGFEILPGDQQGKALKTQISAALSADLERLLSAADQATIAADWDEAEALYQKILLIAPQHAQAKAGIKRLHSARREQAANLFSRGQEALDNGHGDDAADLFKEVLALDPDHELASEKLTTAQQLMANRLGEYLLKGRNAVGRKNFDEARQWFNKALDIEASAKVRAELEKFDQLVSQEANMLAEKASRAAQEKRYKDAQKLYARALQLKPGQSASLAGKNALEKMINESIEESLRTGRDALKNEADQKAATAFRRVLELAPDNQQALDGLRQSRDRQAKKLEQTVALGLAALESGDLPEAQKQLRKALAKNTYHKGAQQLRQRLEMVQQSGAKPGDEKKLYLQGVAFYTQGKYPDAIKAWETVLLLDPEHKKAQLNIDKTRRKLRQIEEYRGG